MINNSNISFGFDVYFLLKSIELMSSDKKTFNSIQDAVETLFVFNWGFSFDEIDELHSIFEKKMDEGKLPGIRETIERIIMNLKNDQDSRDRLLVQSSAIAFLGPNDEESIPFIYLLGKDLGLNQLQVENFIKNGFDLHLCIKYIGQAYLNNNQ